MPREIIHTDKAPKAIGTYSQAVKVDNTVYLSGQIPLIPESMELVDGDICSGTKDPGIQLDYLQLKKH